MAAITTAKNIANGIQVSTSVGVIATINSNISRLQIDSAIIVNSGSSLKTVSIYVLQPTDSIANNFKSNVDLVLAANESYPLLELIGMSIEAGGSIQAIVDSGTDVAMFITGTEFGK